MGFAVDTKHMLNEVIPRYEESFNEEYNPVGRSRGRRSQLHRVCVYAIVTHDAASRIHFHDYCGIGDPKQDAALEWQAEQGDDEDEVEVLHHLKQLAATTTEPGVGSGRPGSGGVESRAGTTTLVASVQSPTYFSSCTQHRPPSSFRRFSSRHIVDTMFVSSGPECYSLPWNSNSWNCNACFNDYPSSDYSGSPRIVFTAAEARCYSVIWVLQFDFLDFSEKGSYSPSGARKRRRTLNPFHHVSPTHDGHHTPPAQDRPAPEAKRFNGVRYRADHKRWVAEMKPPKSKNKVSFGEFRSQTHAARVVDVAFHHYGRPLNFADTPRILSALAPSGALSAEAKLELVKDQTEWVKSRVSSLTSSPGPSTSDTNSGLRPFSAIGSSLILVGSDEADDAVSQPQSGWLQVLMSSAGMGEGQETRDVANGSREVPQSGTRQWSVETGMAHDPSGVFGISPEHLDGALRMGGSFQPMDCGGSMTVGSPAAPSVFPMWRPGAFRMEGADACWEQDIAVVGRDWAAQFQPIGH